jgi:hypothetical protein
MEDPGGQCGEIGAWTCRAGRKPFFAPVLLPAGPRMKNWVGSSLFALLCFSSVSPHHHHFHLSEAGDGVRVSLGGGGRGLVGAGRGGQGGDSTLRR